MSGSQEGGAPGGETALAGVLQDLKAAHNRLLWIVHNRKSAALSHALTADSYLQRAIEALSEGLARAAGGEK